VVASARIPPSTAAAVELQRVRAARGTTECFTVRARRPRHHSGTGCRTTSAPVTSAWWNRTERSLVFHALRRELLRRPARILRSASRFPSPTCSPREIALTTNSFRQVTATQVVSGKLSREHRSTRRSTVSRSALIPRPAAAITERRRTTPRSGSEEEPGPRPCNTRRAEADHRQRCGASAVPLITLGVQLAPAVHAIVATARDLGGGPCGARGRPGPTCSDGSTSPW